VLQQHIQWLLLLSLLLLLLLLLSQRGLPDGCKGTKGTC
jgi:hypothetical protein